MITSIENRSGVHPGRRCRRGRGLLAAGLVCLWPSAPAVPAPQAGEPSEVEALRRELQALREEYERRIAALEARLAALEPAPAEGEGLEALRAAAREAAGLTAEAAPGPPQAGAPGAGAPAVGHERNLSRLNPEISVTGDVLGFTQGSTQDFDVREVELDLQAALDPFSRAKVTLAFEEDEVEIEEGYFSYDGLPGGFGIRGGKMRQTFGVLNRTHLHALPQFDYPLVLQAFLGEEGLAQTGVSVGWLVPRPWASANEITFQLTDTSGELFGDSSFDDLAGLLHLKNFWDLSSSTYLEWGLSGMAGGTDTANRTQVWGTDLTLHWQPPARAKYREITWRTEVMLSQRDDPAEIRRDAWGGYTYVEGLVMRNLYVGARYDWLEDPLDPDLDKWAVEPYVSWWQSEYVRLRALYQRVRGFDDETDNRVTLQVTFAAGPHKHEEY